MARYFFAKHIDGLNISLQKKGEVFYDALEVKISPKPFYHRDALPVTIAEQGEYHFDALPVYNSRRQGIFVDGLKVNITPRKAVFYDSLGVYLCDTRKWRQHVDSIEVKLRKTLLSCFDSLPVCIQKRRVKCLDTLVSVLYRPPSKVYKFEYDLSAGGVKEFVFDYATLKSQKTELKSIYNVLSAYKQKECIGKYGVLEREKLSSVYGCCLGKALGAGYDLLTSRTDSCEIYYDVGKKREKKSVSLKYGGVFLKNIDFLYDLQKTGQMALKADYSLLTLRADSCEICYDGKIRKKKDIEFKYGSAFLKQIDFLYDLQKTGQMALEAEYSLLALKTSGCEFSYDVGKKREKKNIEFKYGNAFFKGTSLAYDIRKAGQKSCLICYALTRQRLGQDCVCKYALTEREFLQKDFRFVYFAECAQYELYQKQTRLFVNGQVIEFVRAQIETAEGDYVISGAFELADVGEFAKVKIGDMAEFIAGDTTFVFIIESKQKRREFGQVSYEIEGRSPTALLDLPYAGLITKKWPQSSAKNIICELAQGFEVIFEIADFPVYDFEIENETPLAGIKRLCEATGAVVETTPEGRLKVRYLYPVSPTEYQAAEPVKVLTDLDDILQIEEEMEIKEDYNVVAVGNDTETEWEMKLIVDDSETNELEVGQTGVLRVWCYPFIDELFLEKSSDALHITYCGVKTGTITEQIEIINGEGTASYFVDEIVSYHYLGDNLGEIKAEGKKIMLDEPIRPAGIVEISYRHQFHEFLVMSEKETKVIVYVED